MVAVWVVAYPTQVLQLDVHGVMRPVKVIGAKDDFRQYEDALEHARFLERIWPGLKLEGPKLVDEDGDGRRPVGRGRRK